MYRQRFNMPRPTFAANYESSKNLALTISLRACETADA